MTISDKPEDHADRLTEAGAHQGDRSMLAVVLGLDAAPLSAGSRVLVRMGDHVEAATVRSIREKLRRHGELPENNAQLRRYDLALLEISNPGVPRSSPAGVVPIELLSETKSRIATGTAISEWKSNRSGHQPGVTVWLTGLSGAGKTTIASGVEQRLRGIIPVERLDADVVRTHLCKDLGYTREDREENIRRLGFLARLLTHTAEVVLVSAISPYQAARKDLRKEIGRFIEVYVNAPLEVCEARDVKGLYKKARRGEVQRFTGIADPYEPPVAPEVECRTDRESIEESIAKVVATIEQKLNRKLVRESS